MGRRVSKRLGREHGRIGKPIPIKRTSERRHGKIGKPIPIKNIPTKKPKIIKRGGIKIRTTKPKERPPIRPKGRMVPEGSVLPSGKKRPMRFRK